jgi:hypothetical protein
MRVGSFERAERIEKARLACVMQGAAVQPRGALRELDPL